jgi:hypothetical protein
MLLQRYEYPVSGRIFFIDQVLRSVDRLNNDRPMDRSKSSIPSALWRIDSSKGLYGQFCFPGVLGHDGGLEGIRTRSIVSLQRPARVT